MQTTKLVAKRLKARYLIVVKGIQQNEVAKIVGVSKVTVCVWNKKYNWKDQAEKALNRKGGIDVIMDEFKAYLRSCDTSLVEKFEKHWQGFIKGLEKEYEAIRPGQKSLADF